MHLADTNTYEKTISTSKDRNLKRFQHQFHFRDIVLMFENAYEVLYSFIMVGQYCHALYSLKVVPIAFSEVWFQYKTVRLRTQVDHEMLFWFIKFLNREDPSFCCDIGTECKKLKFRGCVVWFIGRQNLEWTKRRGNRLIWNSSYDSLCFYNFAFLHWEKIV